MPTNDRVHVFVGSFDNRDSACKYTEPQWEPEPDENASAEEYNAWEEHNPYWQLREDLEVTYLDDDFIETINGENRFEYLNALLTERNALSKIGEFAGQDTNILVLIFSQALGGFLVKMKSTSQLKYCGEFLCKR